MRYRFYEPETKKYQRFTSFSDHLHSLHVSFHNFQYQYLTALFFHLPLKLNDAAFFFDHFVSLWERTASSMPLHLRLCRYLICLLKTFHSNFNVYML